MFEFARRQRRRKGSLAWFATGIGIGSGIALLATPYTGEDIRYAIRRGYRRLAKHVGRQTEDLRDRAGGLIEQAKDLRESAHDMGKRGSKLLRRYRAA
jgi:hypothetical protein